MDKRTGNKYELANEAADFVLKFENHFKSLIRDALADFFYHKKKSALLSWLEEHKGEQK